MKASRVRVACLFHQNTYKDKYNYKKQCVMKSSSSADSADFLQPTAD